MWCFASDLNDAAGVFSHESPACSTECATKLLSRSCKQDRLDVNRIAKTERRTRFKCQRTCMKWQTYFLNKQKKKIPTLDQNVKVSVIKFRNKRFLK